MYFDGTSYTLKATATPLIPQTGFSKLQGGKHLLVVSCSENLNLELLDTGMSSMGVMKGIVAGVGIDLPFGGFNVCTASGGAGTAYIIVSDQPIDLALAGLVSIAGAVTVNGTVNILDSVSLRNRVLGGSMFSLFDVVTGDATHKPLVQLSNPVANNKNFIVWSARVYSTTGAIGIELRSVVGVAALTNDITATAISNKLIGSAVASTAKAYDATGLALPASTVLEKLSVSAANADDDWSGVLEGPIVIQPGYSLLITTGSAATNINISLDWDEA